jgi:glycosyltransferase involved in cell wall biosynthesis
MTKITIVIPTFKEANYITKTLNWIKKLSDDIEVVLVETISDETSVLESALRNHENVSLYKIKERGIARAKNYGARKAKGDILIFLDADVFITKNVVGKVYSVFQDPLVVGATCSNYPVNPKLSELIFFKFYNALIRLALSLPAVKLKHSRGEFIAVKKVYFDKIGGFNEKLVCLEDADLAHRLSKLGKFVFIKDLVVYESMRRIRRLGLFKTVMLWLKNWLFYIAKRDVLVKEWVPVR